WSTRIAGEHLVPLLNCDLFERNGFIHRGIVHKHVEAAHFALDLFHRLVHVALVGNVATQRESTAFHAADLRHQLFSISFGVKISKGNIGAALGHAQCDGASNTTGAAGDDDGLAGEVDAV